MDSARALWIMTDMSAAVPPILALAGGGLLALAHAGAIALTVRLLAARRGGYAWVVIGATLRIAGASGAFVLIGREAGPVALAAALAGFVLVRGLIVRRVLRPLAEESTP